VCYLYYQRNQRWPHRPTGRSQPALSMCSDPDRRNNLVSPRWDPRHRGVAGNRTRQRVETHVLPALLRMNELVEEYLRRGVPTEQAIDTTDALPRSRPLALSIAPRAAVSAAVHFTTPLPRQGEM
jgi:hypothetical protein